MFIREMREEDVNDIVTLEHLLFSSPWNKQDFLYEINDNPFSKNFVVYDDDILVGYLGLWISYEQAQITTIGVNKEYQRQGIGEMMMKYAEDLAIKSGCLQMSLEVRISNNKAISLYEKRLFKKVAIRNNYYEDNHEDAYLMIKELEV